MQWTTLSSAALLAISQAISCSANCLTDHQTNLTATRVRDILGLYNSDLGTPEQTVQQLFAPNFASTSDSYALLGGRLSQVGQFNTTNKQGELNEVANAPQSAAQRGIQTIALGSFDCKKIFWFWNLTILGSTPLKYPVRGMHYLVLNDNWQIVELWTETDSLAYAADRDFKIDYPNGTLLPPQDPAA